MTTRIIMVLTTHVLTGAVIGAKIHSPWIVIILSLALHFFLDTFRHGEYLDRKSKVRDTAWKVALDLLVGFTVAFLGFVIIFFYLKSQPFEITVLRNIFLGVVFSILPDFLTLLYWKGNFKFLKRIYDFHIRIHKYPQGSPERLWTLRNATNDIIISLIAIIILFVK